MMENAPETAPIAGATLAGLGAAALASLGIDPASLFWAIIACSVGVTFAAPASRVRAGTLFVAVALLCSLLGAWVAQRYFDNTPLTRNTCAAVLALVFHPLLSAVVTRVPKVLDGIMRLLKIGDRDGGQP